MIIEVDAGNSYVKWRLVTSTRDAVLMQAVVPVSDIAGQAFPSADRALVSCVSSDSVRAQLEQALSAATGSPPQLVRASARRGRVVSGYKTPEQLGVDRWLAILAASEMTSAPFVVIDAGSALTVDIVDNNGVHRGGYIVPGLSMMRRALSTETQSVRFTVIDSPELGPGCSTERAVNSGLMLMATAFIDRIIDDECGRLGPALTVYLTGGDANVLARVLKYPVFCVPDLVLNGLKVVDQVM